MSAQEIIAELPTLKPEELRLARERLTEFDAAAASETPKTSWSKALLGMAGKAKDLPPDHYLYGTPKGVILPSVSIRVIRG